MARPADDQPTGNQHRLPATQPATLVVAVLAAAGCAWLGLDRFYGSLPRLPWLPPLTLAGLAVVEGMVARQVKAWIDRKPTAKPIEPLLIARYVVLAKASALVGAIFGGLYVGMTSWLLVQRAVLVEADRDFPAAAAGTVGSGILLVAAVVLERACRVPPSADHRNTGGSDRPGTQPGGET
ncbi:MAG: DUF3180 domain-containing protein [Dactylosporangium sp.]|nr:DUF3180 domain-containing protein [Dactylosporangium sp.]NNJ63293.1 DUF3180 domain-containing protein [Dactylosporangium sp.]